MSFSAPIWSSGFRPFFLFGAAYAPLIIVAWAAAYAGLSVAPEAVGLSLWHGHELLCGYGVAVISGFILTAVPSWGETRAVEGGGLALVAALWLAGRVALWAADVLPWWLVSVIDLAYFPALAAVSLPGLLRSRHRAFLLLLPVMGCFFAADLVFHLGVAGALPDAEAGLRGVYYSILLIYCIVGGMLAPIFTENSLREGGWTGRISFSRPLEALAYLSVLAFAGTGLAVPGSPWAGWAAVLALAVHTLRMARWHSFSTLGRPLDWVMHLSYAWLLACFALRALYDFGAGVPESAAMHAFLVGAFGLMKIGFLTRVALRHTGRPHHDVPPAMVFAFGLMFLAAVIRLAAALGPWPAELMTASALLWAAPFLIFLWCHGAWLWRPSLPRADETTS